MCVGTSYVSAGMREENGEYLERFPDLRARAVTRFMTAAQGRRFRAFTFQVGFHVPPAQGQERRSLYSGSATSKSIAEGTHMQSLYWNVGFEVLTASAVPACCKSRATLSTAAQRPVRN